MTAPSCPLGSCGSPSCPSKAGPVDPETSLVPRLQGRPARRSVQPRFLWFPFLWPEPICCPHRVGRCHCRVLGTRWPAPWPADTPVSRRCAPARGARSGATRGAGETGRLANSQGPPVLLAGRGEGRCSPATFLSCLSAGGRGLHGVSDR